MLKLKIDWSIEGLFLYGILGAVIFGCGSLFIYVAWMFLGQPLMNSLGVFVTWVIAIFGGSIVVSGENMAWSIVAMCIAAYFFSGRYKHFKIERVLVREKNEEPAHVLKVWF